MRPSARVVGSNYQPSPVAPPGGVMDVDPSWTFDEYRAYERARLNESLAEQRQARANGLEVDPKSAPHGGYRIACVWSDEATSAVCPIGAAGQAVAGNPGIPLSSHP